MPKQRKSGRNSREVIPIATAVVVADGGDEIAEAKEIESDNVFVLDSNPAHSSSSGGPTRPSVPQCSSLPAVKNPQAARDFLIDHDWPASLADTMINNFSAIPLRFFVIDDSGSMTKDDGRTVATGAGGQKCIIDCSRWAELTHSLKFHLDFAMAGGIPCEFRFLNASPKPIRIGFDEDPHSRQTERDYQSMLAIIEEYPSGLTPLCRQIREVIATIAPYETILRRNRQKAMVIIATDGEASDGNLMQALLPLKELPVWLLLRFCTNEEKVINYWNEIDQQLELNMDVVDDYLSEAEEIQKHNPWLNYAQPFQFMREFGIMNLREFDKLDESLMSADDFWKICKMILGRRAETLSHPQIDLKAFVTEINRIQKEIEGSGGGDRWIRSWNPTSKKLEFLINTKEVLKAYGKPGGGCSIM